MEKSSSLVAFGAGALTTALLAAWYLRKATCGSGDRNVLRDFRLTRFLKITETEIAALGYFRTDPKLRGAVLVIQRSSMDSTQLDNLLNDMSLHEILANDIYSTYLADTSRVLKPYKVNLIYPATEKHIQKHTDQAFHIVRETSDIYESITKPYIESIPTEALGWLYNILDRNTESERIIYEDPDPKTGFILLPDFKWSATSSIDSLYCLAIVHDRSIRSVRDITSAHLPLLKKIRDDGLGALAKQFGVLPSNIRVYVHYQPTYYHFHVHFSHVRITNGTFTGKAVLLEDIIHNLSVQEDYYQKATMSYLVGEIQHKSLYDLFAQKNVLPKQKK